MPLDNERPLIELSRMAAVYHKLHKFDQAEVLYRTAISQLEKSGDDNKQLALSLFGLAEVYSDQTRYGEAVPLYQRAVGIWERLYVTDSLSLLWYSEALAKMQ